MDNLKLYEAVKSRIPSAVDISSAEQSASEEEWDGAFLSLIDSAVEADVLSLEMLTLVKDAAISSTLLTFAEQLANAKQNDVA